MAHAEKFTKGAVFGIANHIERKTKKHSNEDIDISRSKDNYSLLNDDSDLITRLNNRLAEVHVYNRKDVNVMVDWVVTLPEELKGATESEQRAFFSNTHDFLVSRYGGLKNVVCSEIHVDETTPHLHFGFVPVAFDGNRQQERVQANKVVSRRDLRAFHDDLHDYLVDTIPEIYKQGILNGKTLGIDKVSDIKKLDSKIKAEVANKSELLSKITAYKEPLNTYEEIVKNAKRSVFGQVQLSQADLDTIKNLVLSSEKISRSYLTYKNKTDAEIRSFKNETTDLRDLNTQAINSVESLTNEVKNLEIDISQYKNRVSLMEHDLTFFELFTGANFLDLFELTNEEYSALDTLTEMRLNRFKPTKQNLEKAKNIFEAVPNTSKFIDLVTDALNNVLEKLKDLTQKVRRRGPGL